MSKGKLNPVKLKSPKLIGLVERPSMFELYNTSIFEEWTGLMRTGNPPRLVPTTIYKPVYGKKQKARR